MYFGWLIRAALLLQTCWVGFVAADEFEPVSYSLDGRWEFSRGNLKAADGYLLETSVEDWQKIKVPANWYTEGIDHYGVAWYRRSLPSRALSAYRRAQGRSMDRDIQPSRFTSSSAAQPPPIVKIRFAGVDYAADVWLNQRHVGFHEGYFSPFEVDVTDALEGADSAALAVRVNSPEEQGGPSWGLHKRLIKGVLSHHDTRPGGAWSHRGQEKNTGGIWESVTLEIARGAYLAPLQIRPTLRFDQNGAPNGAEILVRSHVDTWRGMKQANATLRLYDPESDALLLEEPLGRVSRRRAAIEATVNLPSPKLWWPAGRGAQPLYRAELMLTDNAGGVLHRSSTRFGVRSVERRPNGAWLINGRRLFLKGTNYIATQWKSAFSAKDYAADLQLMRAANVNIVRVHAQVESQRFYDLADEMGMLVWQDFPLQWGYEDSPEFEAAALTQLGEMITHFGNHPSIVAWSMHNEPPWDADWMVWKYGDYDPEQNRSLDTALFDLANRLDSSRYVHKISRTKEHQWFGWYSGSIDTFAKPLTETLVSEFGAQALPKESSLRKIISPEHLWPDSEDAWAEWAYKNFQRKETFELAKVEAPADLAEFIEHTQSYQKELITFAGAAYRSRQYKPLGGLFQFMFVEDWPSINWGVVDWFRQPKPGYEALRNIYESVVAVPELPGRTLPAGSQIVPVRLVSDLWERTQSVQIAVSLLDANGKIVAGSQRHFSADAPADSNEHVAEWRFSAQPGDYEMRVITRANGRETSLAFELKVQATDELVHAGPKPAALDVGS